MTSEPRLGANREGGRVLNPYFVRRAVERLDLSAPIRTRVEGLISILGGDGRANVADVHTNLYPESTITSANAALSRLARTVNEAAEKAGIPLAVRLTTSKRLGANSRWVWFEGRAEIPEPMTPELDAVPSDQLVLHPRGLPSPEAPVVVLFTYNQHETAAVLNRFSSDRPPASLVNQGVTYNDLGLLGGHRVIHRISGQGKSASQTSAEDAWLAWNPVAMISVGIAYGQNPGGQRIGDVLIATAVYDYELVRRSPHHRIEPRGRTYPSSDVLEQRSLHLDHTRGASPAAVLGWPRLVPGLVLSGDKLIDDQTFKTEIAQLAPTAIGGEMEGVGLATAARHRQVDWALVKGICDWGDGKKNTSTKAADQRLAAGNAALVVHAMLSTGPLWTAPTSHPGWSSPPAKPAPRPPQPPRAFLREINDLGVEYYNLLASPSTMNREMPKTESQATVRLRETPPDLRPTGVDVMAELTSWVDAEIAPPVFVLLGEYGMGKTITCQRFAQELERRWTETGAGRPALYFDLRSITGLDRRVPILDEILQECMARDWSPLGEAEAFTANQVHIWVALGAVVIFDGLDEALVKMSARDGQTLTRTLLSIVDTTRQGDRQWAKPPRLLISCRTQYFRTLRDQQNHFTGHERRNTRAEYFRALTLLPLTDDQVRGYMASAVPGRDPVRTLEVLRSIHNLEELTHRPYTLQLVGAYIPELEEAQASGRAVHGVTLYRAMARTWLERDEGKHHIRPDDKMLLAEHLAAHLWRNRHSALGPSELEDWFHQWRESVPSLRLRYSGLPIEQLEEDLRTATFLARDDTKGVQGFRFAHTSLLEFFLSQHLFKGLVAGDPDCWALPTPSPETLVFIAQSIAEHVDRPQLLDRLSRWGQTRRPGVNENILAIALAAREDGMPAPALRGIDLSNADLSHLVIAGSGGLPLDVSDADFGQTVAYQTTFVNVILDRAIFNSSRLLQAEFLDCSGSADWEGAHTQGAVWRVTSSENERVLDESSLPAPWRRGGLADEIIDTPLVWTTGHTGRVRACAFSPDGAVLATAGDDGSVRLWDPNAGAEIRQLMGHSGRINDCTFSPDGSLLASAGDDGSVRLWDPHTGAQIRELKGHTNHVNSCAFSPDGSLLATAGDDSPVRLWDPHTGAEVRALTTHTDDWVLRCTFSPDGALLVSAYYDGLMRLWDPMTGTELRTLSGHTDWVRMCVFSPDGAILASASDDGSVRLWDPQLGHEIRQLTGHKDWVEMCAFSPDGALIASVGDDGSVRLWDPTSGAQIRQLDAQEGAVTAGGFSPDGRLLAIAAGRGTIRLWDPLSGIETCKLLGENGWVDACAFSPDGALLASSGDDGIVHLWDPRTGVELRRLASLSLIQAIAFSPDGRLLCTAEVSSLVRIWDPSSGAEACKLIGHTGWVRTCEFSPDGSLLATAGDDGSVRLWDPYTGAEIRQLMGHTGRINDCTFSPDGSLLASAGDDGSVRLWDPHTGAEIRQLTEQTGRIIDCAFSPEGSLIASAGDDGSVRLWDPSTGAKIRTLTTHTDAWIRACVFSPDGALLISAGNDGLVRLWDPTTGAELRTLSGHTDWVKTCAFSPDGTILASASVDGTMRTWGIPDGDCRRVYGFVPYDATWRSGTASWDPLTGQIFYAQGTCWRGLHQLSQGHDGRPYLRAREIPSDVPGEREAAAFARRSR